MDRLALPLEVRQGNQPDAGEQERPEDQKDDPLNLEHRIWQNRVSHPGRIAGGAGVLFANSWELRLNRARTLTAGYLPSRSNPAIIGSEQPSPQVRPCTHHLGLLAGS